MSIVRPESLIYRMRHSEIPLVWWASTLEKDMPCGLGSLWQSWIQGICSLHQWYFWTPHPRYPGLRLHYAHPRCPSLEDTYNYQPVALCPQIRQSGFQQYPNIGKCTSQKPHTTIYIHRSAGQSIALETIWLSHFCLDPVTLRSTAHPPQMESQSRVGYLSRPFTCTPSECGTHPKSWHWNDQSTITCQILS